ncbi:hypothetical protein [Hymenobacter baengnokdamensis]|uniref:hypothetical protein n=1 Tax=Hymenobacter baengnokdamensis TaxID=2615203 RepID=UPI0012470373|nr:hypothetical protein [Hymenobacter baengnokdamensis]
MPFPLTILLALVIALANDYADHLQAPIGILLTPLVIISITALLHTNRHPQLVLPAAVATALLLCLHDAGIKLYGGGMHDLEGQGFVNLFLFAGLLPAYLLQSSLVRRTQGVSPRVKRWTLWVGPLLVGSYLLFFGSLGLGRSY